MTDQEKVPEAAALDVIAEEKAQKALERKAKNAAAREALLEDMDEVERMLVAGDISKIAASSELRTRFIAMRHYRLGIPYTPGAIIFIATDGKVIPYDTAVCASAIRASKGWTSKIVAQEVVADGAVYTVTMRVYDPKQPDHFADNMGALPLKDSGGQALAPSEIASNMKKTLTQAERRATFSLAGIAGADPREDGGPMVWYPEQSLQELKVIEPKARLVSAAKLNETVTATVPQAVAEGIVAAQDASALLMAQSTSAEAPKKRRVVKRKDGTVVPQPQPQGVEPAETATRMPIPAPAAGPSASPTHAAPVAGVEGLPPAAVPQEAPQEAPVPPPCDHPGMVRWLASAPKGRTHPCPDCEEVLVAPGPPKPAAPAPGPNVCLHPALKSGKPGHVYCCPPPPEGCGQEVRIPGEPEPIKVATTPMPVRPRAVRIVKRVTPR